MRFLEMLFGRKADKPAQPAKKTVQGPTKKVDKKPITREYSGPIVGLFKTVEFHSQQNILLELKTPADLTSIPMGMFAADPFSAYLRSIGAPLYGRGEDAIDVAENAKAQIFVSGGRSFRRPTWFSDLQDCGAFMFLISNNHSVRFSGMEWQIRNATCPSAPVLIIINNGSFAGEESKRLFTKPPTTEEFAKALQMDESVFVGHPVKILLCDFQVTRKDEASEGDSKEKANSSSSSPVFEFPESAEVAEAIKWLSELIVVDSHVAARIARRETAEAEKIAKQEAEDARKKKEEEEKEKAKQAVPLITPQDPSSTGNAALAA